MAKSKPESGKSLTALAKALDTRKREAPVAQNKAQRDVIQNALRAKPVVPARDGTKIVNVMNLKPEVKAPAPFTSRTTALTSLQRTPSPVPAKVPVAAPAATAKSDPRRAYPRADIAVRAKLSLADDPSRSFEASLPTVNLSVGGMFLESSFFLKLGTRLLVELDLPKQKNRTVKVKADVVRVESSDGASGFALRFTEYLEGSQVTLATHFLSPVLREFLSQYAKEHRFEASAEYLAHTADVLAAWELRKAELGGDVWDLFAK